MATSPAVELESVFLREVFDALPEQVVVLGNDGRIVAFNDSWVEFAWENGNPALIGAAVGDDYLAACRIKKGRFAGFARQACEGIEAVMRRERASFGLVYPGGAPNADTWFLLQARPLPNVEGHTVLSHSRITDVQLVRQALSPRPQGENSVGPGLPGRRGVRLAPRQKRVLELLVGGFKNREIAEEMGVSEKTVDYHLRALKRKIGCDRSADLIRVAVEQNLV